MATAELENGQATTETLGITKEMAIERWGAPPAGMRYRLVGGSVQIGSDLKPVVVPVKPKGAKKGSGKGKKAGLKYAVPSGGLQTSEAPGFVVDGKARHNKLMASDFANKLHYLEWCVWYERQRVSAAEKALEEYKLSQTPEGKAESEKRKIREAMESALKNDPALAKMLLEMAAAAQIGIGG